MPVAERKFSRHSGGANKDYLETILDVSLIAQDPANVTYDVQIVKQEFPVDFNLELPAEGDTFEEITGGIILNDAWFNYDPTALYFENLTKEEVLAMSNSERVRYLLTPRYRVLLEDPMIAPAGGGGGKFTYTAYTGGDNRPNVSAIYAMYQFPPFTAASNTFTGEFLYSVFNNEIDDYPEVGDDGSAYANIVLRFKCQFWTNDGPTAKYDSSAGSTDVRTLFPNANNY